MIGKKITTTNIIEDRCEDLNKKQIKIYNDQIKLVEDKICDHCKKEYWELIDRYLYGYYYEMYPIDEGENPDEWLWFEMFLTNDEIKCKKCMDHWNTYIDMDDQRFRISLKQQKCIEELITMETNQKKWNKFK